jgi:hypothetical protein
MEQRIREMNLVHDMLRIAMAEEAEEGDEVKEQAEKEMEKTMADLKSKLEEARRNEGKESPSLQEDEVKEPADVGTVTEKARELQAGLDASHERVSSI